MVWANSDQDFPERAPVRTERAPPTGYSAASLVSRDCLGTTALRHSPAMTSGDLAIMTLVATARHRTRSLPLPAIATFALSFHSDRDLLVLMHHMPCRRGRPGGRIYTCCSGSHSFWLCCNAGQILRLRLNFVVYTRSFALLCGRVCNPSRHYCASTADNPFASAVEIDIQRLHNRALCGCDVFGVPSRRSWRTCFSSFRRIWHHVGP